MADFSPAAVKKSLHSFGKSPIPSFKIISPNPRLRSSFNILLITRTKIYMLLPFS